MLSNLDKLNFFLVWYRINSQSDKQQNVRPVRIESICREQNKYEKKNEICLEREENNVRKGENAGLLKTHFLPQCFQKASY